MNTLEEQIVQMYKKVAIPFLHVALARGEKLTEQTLNNIVTKFLLIERTMGSEVVDDHLEYEVEKYRREGLRSDYR